MNETKRLSITMTRGERVLGWLYVPFFLVLLAWILAEGFRLLGWDTGTLLGQARAERCVLRGELPGDGPHLPKVPVKIPGHGGPAVLGLSPGGDSGPGDVLCRNPLHHLGGSALAARPGECERRRHFRHGQGGPVGDGGGHRASHTSGGGVHIPGPPVPGVAPAQPAAAYALSTAAFCLVHVAGYVGQTELLSLAILALEYIPAGIALAWAYEKADTIFAPVLMHSLINALSIRTLW